MLVRDTGIEPVCRQPHYGCIAKTITPAIAAASFPGVPHRPITARSITEPPTGPTAGKPTSMDETLACGIDNRRVKPGGWRTRKRKDGRTEWIPPPNLDTGQARVKNYHHPERYLLSEEEEADGDID